MGKCFATENQRIMQKDIVIKSKSYGRQYVLPQIIMLNVCAINTIFLFVTLSKKQIFVFF